MNTFRATTRTLSLVTLLGIAVVSPALAQNYHFTNFDGPGLNGGGTTVNGLNNNGTEVGFSADASLFLFTNFLRTPTGVFTSLNLLDPLAMANGVNSNNAVVGATGDNAFLLQNGLLITLPAVKPGSTAAEVAFGINDKGAIVGQYTDNGTDTTPGFVDNNGVFTILNPVANATVTNAQGINNRGLVTGFYSTDGVHQHGFLYNTTTGTYTLLTDPSTPQIAADGLELTQFLGINDQNEAVGYYQTNNGSQFGFLFNTQTNTYSFLDDPLAAPVNGVQITQITGINDKGDLSGFFVDANGIQRGFLATPVPEPGSLTLLTGGAVSLLVVLRRKRSHR